jgi:thiamine biosynthesis lipoprotein
MIRLPVTFWFALLSGLAAAEPASAEPALSRFAFTEPHMGTRFRIVLYAPDAATAGAAAKAAFARIAALDNIMSDYKANSELMELCRNAVGRPVRLGDDLFTVMKAALALSRRSDGAFDVTVGPMSQLWRRTRKTRTLPTAEELADAKRRTGYEKVRLDEPARTVELATAGMQLDLGGIAKGYAADEALKVLRARGVTRALVAAGGDIAVSDAPPDAAGWKIGIAPVEDSARPPSRFLLLVNAAVSTSGDAEQHIEIGGVRYSHVLDPKTGLGLTGRHSVSVVAGNGMTSDSMTKVLYVLGPARGMTLIEATPGLSALFIEKTDGGERATASKGWKEAEK